VSVGGAGGDAGERYPPITIEAWARHGDAERIGAVGEALAVEAEQVRERLRFLNDDLAFVLRVLALTPGRRFVEQLLALSPQARHTRASDPRLLASLIAEAQSLDDALYVLRHAESDEHHLLRACLFHELLLRGADPGRLLHRATRRPDLLPFTWSPLAWLPARLSEMETELGAWLPSRGYRNSASGSVPAMMSPAPVDVAARRAAARHRVREATPAHLIELIGGPPADGRWGDHEVRVFETDEPVVPGDLPGVVTTLPMDCLRGLGGQDRFEGEMCTLDTVWLTLFMTASAGGFGTSGVHGAFGRLSAWRSLAGLCGADPTASAAEVEKLARACTWYRFEADAEWFHNDLADYGIVALSPDGRRVAVLAATTTD
jgi:hypothetical protein